jgi:hypothetical protein
MTDEHAAHEARIDSSLGTSHHATGHNAALFPPAPPEVINLENAQVKPKEGNMSQESSKTPAPLDLYRAYRGYVEHEAMMSMPAAAIRPFLVPELATARA